MLILSSILAETPIDLHSNNNQANSKLTSLAQTSDSSSQDTNRIAMKTTPVTRKDAKQLAEDDKVIEEAKKLAKEETDRKAIEEAKQKTIHRVEKLINNISVGLTDIQIKDFIKVEYTNVLNALPEKLDGGNLDSVSQELLNAVKDAVQRRKEQHRSENSLRIVDEFIDEMKKPIVKICEEDSTLKDKEYIDACVTRYLQRLIKNTAEQYLTKDINNNTLGNKIMSLPEGSWPKIGIQRLFIDEMKASIKEHEEKIVLLKDTQKKQNEAISKQLDSLKNNYKKMKKGYTEVNQMREKREVAMEKYLKTLQKNQKKLQENDDHYRDIQDKMTDNKDVNKVFTNEHKETTNLLEQALKTAKVGVEDEKKDKIKNDADASATPSGKKTNVPQKK